MEEEIICSKCNGAGSYKTNICARMSICNQPENVICGISCVKYIPFRQKFELECDWCNGSGRITWIDNLFMD